MTRQLAVLLTLAVIVTATEAKAQHLLRRGQRQPASPPSGTSSYSSHYSGSAATSPPARTYSYSYYTLSPLPPRTYVGYKADEFPYHGAPYGHPYDPWTWSTLSGSYGNGLARYYSPPVK